MGKAEAKMKLLHLTTFHDTSCLFELWGHKKKEKEGESSHHAFILYGHNYTLLYTVLVSTICNQYSQRPIIHVTFEKITHIMKTLIR